MSRPRAGAVADPGHRGGADNVLLHGRLDAADLFEVCQFLLLGQKTGVLEIESRGKRGGLYFDQGQIVNAVDDALADGEEAAYRIFTWATGTFTFRREAPPALRSIHTGTESLILDIARFMDERREERAQRGEGPEGDRPEQWTHEEAVKKRGETSDELRVLFQKLRGERGGAEGQNDPLARLWEDARAVGTSAILLRPGEPALGLKDGRMSPLPHTLAADTVTMAIAALGASEGGAQRRASSAGAFVVSLLKEAAGEALFLKGVPRTLAWHEVGLPIDWLEELSTAPRGLVWLGAPPASGRSATARALAEELAARGRFTVLLSEDVNEAGRGALSLRATHVDRIEADLRQALHEGASAVVLDLVNGVRPAAVAHAAARSLVVACEPTPDLRTLLSRAAYNARARALFLGALFVTLAGEPGHFESVWLPEEARYGLDLVRNPDKICGLPEDPSAMSDAGPMRTAA